MTRTGWLHCAAGASGDMLLGALVGAGAPMETLQAAIDAVSVEPVRLQLQHVTRHGLAATKVNVDVGAASAARPRTWTEIRNLLIDAELAEPVRTTALDAFTRLARAEATAHGTSPADVHFHEVGGLDAIADIVGTAAGLHALGVDELWSSPVALGLGTAAGAHGVVPVPAPAVLALLAEVGAPVHSGTSAYELCTPTGAALLAATVTHWGGLPPMVVEAVGTGAGSRDLEELPNLLRLVIGRPVTDTAGDAAGDATAGDATATLVEANVDDLDPRLWPAVLSGAMAAGAADAWLTPILMKKGRPAHTVSVLLSGDGTDATAAAVRRLLFRETSTIGLRESRVSKQALERETLTVEVDGQPVRIKRARLAGCVVSATPEYDDVAAAAAVLQRPVKAVLAAAAAAAHAAGLAP